MSDYKTFDLSSLCNEKLEIILAPLEKEDERLDIYNKICDVYKKTKDVINLYLAA